MSPLVGPRAPRVLAIMRPFWIAIGGRQFLVRQAGEASCDPPPSRLSTDVLLALHVEVLAVPDGDGWRYAFDGFGGYWAPTREACEDMLRFFGHPV